MTRFIYEDVPDSVLCEERQHDDATWVAIRARGSQFSLLTPEEAVAIAQTWIARYGTATC